MLAINLVHLIQYSSIRGWAYSFCFNQFSDNKILKLAISNKAYYSVKRKMINYQKKSQKLVGLMSVEKKMKNFQKVFQTISEKSLAFLNINISINKP